MNIFVLDKNPRIAAQYHADTHVVKMILESAQLLSTAHYVLDGEAYGYKPTHINHPCAVWVRESDSNYAWLYQLFRALGLEYKYRYGKEHKSINDLSDYLCCLPHNIESIGLTPFALAMPDEFKVIGNAVESYRQYYKNNKKHLLNYTRRRSPSWIE